MTTTTQREWSSDETTLGFLRHHGAACRSAGFLNAADHFESVAAELLNPPQRIGTDEAMKAADDFFFSVKPSSLDSYSGLPSFGGSAADFFFSK